MSLGLRRWLWALLCPLPRELDHNDISGTIEDTNGAFTGLENLSKLWVSLGLKFCKAVVLCAYVGVGLSDVAFFPLEQDKNQQKIWGVVVLQAYCKSANVVIRHLCFEADRRWL